MNKLAIALALSILSITAYAQGPGTCAALTALAIPNTKILQAQPIGPSEGSEGVNTTADLPSACRILAQIKPAPDSDIHMELLLPTAWNGFFRGQGNGGFAGSIDEAALARAAAQGYATAATDTGHSASIMDASWAYGHPEKIVDFGYRAVHEMTTASQAIIQAFYGSPAKHSFFSGCSDGGREALMEAQRFPSDYDGILAGAPAADWTALMSAALSNAQTLTRTPGSYIPAAKLPAISAAVLAACDAKDGLKDGVLNDPRACHLNVKVLRCQRGDGQDCLTPDQIKSLQVLYAGARSTEGTVIMPGYLPGSELGRNGWANWIVGDAPDNGIIIRYAQSFFSDMVYEDPKWDFHNVAIEDAYTKANQRTGAMLNATNPDLTPFFSRGGKLILYHGWNDPAVPALATVSYFSRMTSVVGPEAAASSRLYMVPGMQHCAAGPGPTFFGQLDRLSDQGPDDPEHNVSLALEQWVDRGIAPEAIIASRDAGPSNPKMVTMTRPLCPYPQSARYKGIGDPNVAASFVCALK